MNLRILMRVLALAVLTAANAHADGVLRADPQTLATVLERAGPGDTVLLAPGDYPPLRLGRGGSPTAPLALRAADRAARPVFPALQITETGHLVLDGLSFKLRPIGAGDRRSFVIRDARDIRLGDLTFDGTRDAEGPWGLGLGVHDTIGLRLRDSTFRGFAQGVVITRSSDVTVTGNLVHGMRSDGMNFAQVSDVRIEDNVIRDFDRTTGIGDHADMIQFWTRNTDRPSTGIVIRGNLLNSGTGLFTQSIFMRNEAVDSHSAGADMFYRDVVIEENLILNAHLHGISIGATEGLTIRNNTVARNAASSGKRDDPGLWTPRIRVDDRSRDVLVLGNVAHAVPDPAFHGDWTVAGNLLIQDRVPGQADHYDRVFHAVSPLRPALAEHFVARAGGPLDGATVGAPMLRALGAALPQVAPDLPEAPTAGMRGRIRLDPEAQALVADGGAGRPLQRLEIGGPAILVGDALDPVVLPREMTAPLFDARAFEITLHLTPRDGYRSHGEVLRLHQAMRVWLTGRGAVEVELLLEGGGATRLRTRPTRILRDGSGEITISYRGPAGMLTVREGDEVIGERAATGILPPRGSWGLSFGNPFGTKESFEGSIDAFELHGVPDALAQPARTAWRPDEKSLP
ncbi:right-handed parallel beta-helix repeat-containing protein [Jannaschia sp. S6380]|uniref:right-handed parallel beta-helix repeat-containing protein n=1 Tax=Jannaschia sp. S6380 TaxID=2926408 RepID=UPI001FF39665|nr:right-handed parallel beta-helix repeat-containing protein [Jannaschia sp. S6380]MCK0168695.1 right-handed parallel beta-helix repeat-containing protein [Jannaschia sp. S6380]